MKKLFLLSLLVIPSYLWAQGVEEEISEYKPVAGQKTLELQLSPFGEYPIRVGGLRFRSFSTSQQAFRMNFSLGFNLNTNISQQEEPSLNRKELKSIHYSYFIGLSPGMEYHLKGTERISPYYGWEGTVAFRQFSEKTETQIGDEIYYRKTVNANNQGYYRLGANVLAGLDFYLTKKLYLGAELSFGASYTNFLPTKTTSDDPNFNEPEPVRRGSSIGLGLDAISQFRLGYAF